MRPFLTAEWRNLILLTYSVEPSKLQPWLPDGLTLDIIDDRAFVSFVAFDFLRTRVKGLPIPFHINFPEINLRFYVKKGEQRGVMFIKELVPKPCIALVARKLYNEPYEATPMKSFSKIEGSHLIIEHFFEYGGRKHDLKFVADNEPFMPEADSTATFFKEHEWGYGLDHNGKLQQYRVEHPLWRIYPLRKRFHLNVDFGLLYGETWDFLGSKIPYSVLLAEGSAIKVFPGEIA
ncbi:MAG: DUF2071 domain-containing protein [Bacteroidota bacterium]